MLFRRHWVFSCAIFSGIFPVQCCLEPIGQHFTKFLHVQYCPKSIKTALNRIFSCAMLSGAILTILQEVLPMQY